MKWIISPWIIRIWLYRKQPPPPFLGAKGKAQPKTLWRRSERFPSAHTLPPTLPCSQDHKQSPFSSDISFYTWVNFLDLNMNATDWLRVCISTALCLSEFSPVHIFTSAGKARQWHSEGLWNRIFWLIKSILPMLHPMSFNLFSSRFLNGALQGGWAWILLKTGLCP